MQSHERQRRGSDYIRQVVEDALDNLTQDEQRQNFAKALYMSVKLDLKSTPPSPCSPPKIEKETKFNIDEQRSYGLILTKGDAYQFLSGFGMKSLSEPSFKKKYNGRNLANLFGQPEVSRSGNNIVCTYAQWLHASGFIFEPELPDTVINLLPAGWIPPCPAGASPIIRNEAGNAP